MDKERLSDAIGMIDDKYIAHALDFRPARKLHRYAVANFLLVMIIVGFNMTTLFRCSSADKGADTALLVDDVIIHNGAYYSNADMDDISLLAEYNLPYEITPDMLGERLTAGAASLSDAETTEEENEMYEIYVYEPYSDITTSDGRNCRSVYVMDPGGEYSYLLFCNFISFDSNTHTEFTELLSVYGIDEADDIQSVTVGDKHYSGKDDIARLFAGFTSSKSMGNDDFDDMILGSDDSLRKADITEQMAMTGQDIKITSVSGVVANNLIYYPTINCIHWAGSYFRLEEDIS